MPQRIVADVRTVMPADGIVALDNGMYKIWFARSYRTPVSNTLLLDNALATMGAGLPSAMMAALTYPDRRVLAVCGDGGFMMNSQELETAVRLGLNLVVLILQDDAYGMIRWKQAVDEFVDFGMTFGNPDFVAYAQAYGAHGFAGGVHRGPGAGPAVGVRARWRPPRGRAGRLLREHPRPRRRAPQPRAGDRRTVNTPPTTGDAMTATITDQREAAVLAAVPNQLLIGGSWRASSSGATLPVEDPATGQTLVHVADATPEDGEAALSAAVAAGRSWAATAPRERGEILRRAYEAIVAQVDELALLMTLEMGKSVAESRGEILYAAEFFRWFSEEAVRIGGRFATAPDGRTRLLTSQRPVGPCLLITPWNFPMAMGTRKIGPAVAAGCTMVVKPAAQTPLSMLALARILVDAGLPDGVLNVITTSASGQVMEPLIRDPRLRKLSFTGSTPVGQRLIEQSAQRVLRTSMELGGNAPFVVFDDADIDRAVEGAVQAKMRNVGQACTAANRFHVQAGIAPEFTRRLADRLAAMTLGRGTDDGVEVGPLVDDAGRTKVAELVDDAVRKGATVATGGRAVDRPGLLLRAHRAGRRARDGADPAGGGVRTGGADHDLHDRGRGHRRGERHRVRARGVRLHPRPRAGDARVRVAGGRDGRPEPRHHQQPRGALRRDEGQRLRPRRRCRGHPRVPRDAVRRHRRLLTGSGRSTGTRPDRRPAQGYEWCAGTRWG